MRRLMRLAVTLGALSALAVMLAAPPAHADVGGGGDDSLRYMKISGADAGGGGGGGGGGGSGCTWRDAYASTFHWFGGSPYKDEEITDMLADTTGKWYEVRCPGWVVGAHDAVFVPNGTPAADPFAMAQELFKYLKAPSLTAMANPMGSTPVKMPTWFYIDDPRWDDSITVTGTVAESTRAFQAASLTATADRVVWNTGEGSLTCPVPGQKWTSGTPPMAASNCSYVYQTPAEQRYVSARVIWPVEFEAWGVVRFTQPFGSINSNSPAIPLRVVEVQTINN